MKLAQIKEIANAVLYEGYLLYPYRRSAMKNRQRWTLGVVYPRTYSEANNCLEPWTMQTECLFTGNAQTTITVHVRFLHLIQRKTEENNNGDSMHNDATWSAARNPALGWEEGIEREITLHHISPVELLRQPLTSEFAFPGQRMVETPAEKAAQIIREQQSVSGNIQLSAQTVAPGSYRLRVLIANTTPTTAQENLERGAIILHSFVSTHTIMQIEQGAFLSLLDPPEEQTAAAQACQNLHTWPVLIGDPGEHNTLLSSPIILYDYPQIAPESAGPLFDGTEIDEILTLRIMTLTDAEKQEIRQGDERAREILERTEALTAEQLLKLHGVLRDLRQSSEKESASAPDSDYPPPVSVNIAGKDVQAGQHVVLHPTARADAFDILLDGKTARVAAIQQDLENRTYLVVTLDDDPGREQWDERILPGHRFFFYPDEVEVLEDHV